MAAQGAVSKESILARVGILPKWSDSTWDDFVVDNAAKKKAQLYCKNYKEIKKDGLGLYIQGVNGCGKTLLAMLILKELFFEYKQSVRAITMSTLINEQTLGWYDKQMRSEFINSYQSSDFLLIEGVGREHKSGQNDLGATVLDTILSFRAQAKKPVIITSTIAPKNLRSVYNGDIASLLNEICLPIIFNVSCKDYRETTIHGNMIKKHFNV